MQMLQHSLPASEVNFIKLFILLWWQQVTSKQYNTNQHCAICPISSTECTPMPDDGTQLHHRNIKRTKIYIAADAITTTTSTNVFV